MRNGDSSAVSVFPPDGSTASSTSRVIPRRDTASTGWRRYSSWKGDGARAAAPRSEIAEGFKALGPGPGLGQGVEPLPPQPFAPIKEGCGWLRAAHETGGEEFSNSEWNLTTLCATFIENGR